MKRTFFLLIVISIPFCLNAQIFNNLYTDNQLQTRLDTVVHQITSEVMKGSLTMGISIGITYKGKTCFYNYGTIEKRKQQLPTRNTIYEIGSITKTFTGILLAKAVLEKKVQFNDDVRKYLTGNYDNLQYLGQPITLLNLANHSSGLPEDIMPEGIYNLKNPTMFDIVNFFEGDSGLLFKENLRNVKIDTLPGTRIQYSNAGMITLGIILENIYNDSYSNLVRKYITSPLGMDNTEIVSFHTDTLNYTKGYDKNLNIMPHITYQIAGAAGGLKSTSNDLMKFVNENILEQDKAIELAHKKSIEINGQVIGLGWQIKPNSDKSYPLWHDGGEPGFSSYCIIIPTKKIGIVCLTNTRGFQYEFSQLSANIIERLLK